MKSRMDVGQDCVALSCQKNIASPVGSFSVTLLPRTGGEQTHADVHKLASLYKSDLLNRVISIGYDMDGGIMLGLIGNVSERWGIQGGRLTRSLTLTGQDMGKILVRDNIMSVLVASIQTPDAMSYQEQLRTALGDDSPLLSYIHAPTDPADPELSGFFEGKHVTDVVAWALKGITSMRIPLLAEAFGGRGIAGDWMQVVASSYSADVVWSRTLDLATYSGSVWGFISSLVDQDFYECWVDTLPTTTGFAELPAPILVLRPKPFDEDGAKWASVPDEPGLGWKDLTTMVYWREHHDIGLESVYQATFSTGEEDALSHYSVWSAHCPASSARDLAEGMAFPLTDTYAVKRFGLRQYKANLSLAGGDLSAYTDPSSDAAANLAGEVTQARNRAFNWYRPNPWFEDATLVVCGKDEYRVGDPVRLPWREAPLGGEVGMRYYCTAVAHSWSAGAPYTCQLTLARGHNGGMLQEVSNICERDALINATPNPDNFGAM